MPAGVIQIFSGSAPWHVGARAEDGTAKINIGALARALATVPISANGQLEDPDEATQVLRGGEADLIALGRAALANPDRPTRVAQGRAPRPYDRDMLWPEVTLANSQRWKQRRELPALMGLPTRSVDVKGPPQEFGRDRARACELGVPWRETSRRDLPGARRRCSNPRSLRRDVAFLRRTVAMLLDHAPADTDHIHAGLRRAVGLHDGAGPTAS